MISLFCAGFFGFSIGIGTFKIAIISFIIAIVLDFISKMCSSKIEQNKNSSTIDL